VAKRVVIITGGSKGIGLGIARYLSRQGTALTITARREERLRAVAAELEADGVDVLAVAGSVSDRDGVHEAVRLTVERFGRVDGLVNNAQSFRPVMPLEDVRASDMDLLFDTGPKGTLWAMQAVLPHMTAQGSGRIVNFGSVMGVRGSPGYGPYGASKEAIRGLTRIAAQEWGRHGIIVNCVCPASAAHRLPPQDSVRRAGFDAMYANHPLGHDGDAEDDIAPVVAFLLSEECRYLTGETLMVDGGGYMRA
jgi:NAD(P)-dependent dehydrogenase (short-subunit alcohol dehydrogenase family)